MHGNEGLGLWINWNDGDGLAAAFRKLGTAFRTGAPDVSRESFTHPPNPIAETKPRGPRRQSREYHPVPPKRILAKLLRIMDGPSVPTFHHSQL